MRKLRNLVSSKIQLYVYYNFNCYFFCKSSSLIHMMMQRAQSVHTEYACFCFDVTLLIPNCVLNDTHSIGNVYTNQN
jgi:hypothetical protein